MRIDYPIQMKMAEGLGTQPASKQFNDICASKQGRRQTLCYYDETPLFEAAKLVLQTQGFL